MNPMTAIQHIIRGTIAITMITTDEIDESVDLGKVSASVSNSEEGTFVVLSDAAVGSFVGFVVIDIVEGFAVGPLCNIVP